MELITTAIVAALAKLSDKAVADGYGALKSLLTRKFGETSDIATAAEKLEQDPASEAWRAVLDEEVKKLGAALDEELAQSVAELQGSLERAGVSVTVNVGDQATVQGVVGAGTVEVGDMTFGAPKKD